MSESKSANGNGHVSHVTEALLREVGRSLREDKTLPGKVFNSQEIHELEQERLFAHAWVFMAHETEIEQPGDYVVRYIGDDQFIVVRGEDGKVHAHFNSCRHRGMQVCRAEMGNASHFRCPYHGWTYRNNGDLVGVPAAKEAYGKNFDKGPWGLLPIPQLDSYKGLIFGCLDPDAPSLDEFLGGMKFYLDFIVDRTEGGLEVVGAPQRWIIDANWKLSADNFIGDDYHTLMAHRSMVELGIAPSEPQFAMYGEHVHAGNGHGVGLVAAPPEVPLPPFLGLPEEIIGQIVRRLDPVQVEVLRKTVFLHGLVFPNLGLLNVWISKDHLSLPAPMLTMRVFRPLGPDKMEMWSWFMVDRDGPDWYREECYQTYVHTFGSSGVFEQDDDENWRSITRVLQGTFARRQNLNYQMGQDTLQQDPDWPGPGEAYPLAYTEFNQRAFHGRWLDYMLGKVDWPSSNGAAGGSGQAATAATKKG